MSKTPAWSTPRTEASAAGTIHNTASAAKLLGIGPWAFNRRQQRTRWREVGILQSYPMLFADRLGRQHTEDGFLEQDVLAELPERLRKPGWHKTDDGGYLLSRKAAAKRARLADVRRLEKAGLLTPIEHTSPAGHPEIVYALQQVDEAIWCMAKRKSTKPRRKARPKKHPSSGRVTSVPAHWRKYGERHRLIGRQRRTLPKDRIVLPDGTVVLRATAVKRANSDLRMHYSTAARLAEQGRVRRVNLAPAGGRPIWGYVESDLRREKPRLTAKFDGAWDTPEGRRFNLARAELESGLSRTFLKKQLIKCRHLPEGKLASEKKYPPDEFRRWHPRNEHTISETDLKRLKLGIRDAIQDGKALGRQWLNAEELAERHGVRGLERTIRIGWVLKQARKAGRLHPIRACRERNGTRHWSWHYHVPELDQWIADGCPVDAPEPIEEQARPERERRTLDDAAPLVNEKAKLAADAKSDASGRAKKAKRSTERGEGRVKLIAALTRHHKYADSGSLNLEPVGNNELAHLAQVSRSTASRFFKKEFEGRTKYRAACRDAGRLADSLKALNGEFSPHDLYGRRPAGEDARDDDE